MATSQNGYPVSTSAPSGDLRWITGRVKPGDTYTVFDYLCERFNNEVEKIIVSHSWGWAYRAVRGASSGYSNHASGTAIDLNAPAHPLGVRGTFTPNQVKGIRAILADLDGAIRWGGDYTSRADDMHFEVNCTATHLASVADKIRNGQVTNVGKTPANWKPRLIPVSYPKVRRQFLIAAGAKKGTVNRNNGVARTQQALNRKTGAGLTVDGYAGPATLNAYGDWKDTAPSWGLRRRVPDARSFRELGKGQFFVHGLGK